MPEENTQQLFSIGGLNNSVVGPDIASVAGTIATPTHRAHRVTGALAIVNIPLPHPLFEGEIILLPTGVFTWTAAGNIALAGTAVVGKALYMFYNQKTAKWYPSYIA